MSRSKRPYPHQFTTISINVVKVPLFGEHLRTYAKSINVPIGDLVFDALYEKYNEPIRQMYERLTQGLEASSQLLESPDETENI